ncbi:hypothetical protein FXO37_00091 [Capsicum annuum]|nr:hypothetical protein FXO37_00091 [Capsicum annuum]
MRENPSFCCSVPLTIMVLLDGVCGVCVIVGGGVVVVVVVALVVFVVAVGDSVGGVGIGDVCGGCWIKYVEDDKHSKEGVKRWIKSGSTIMVKDYLDEVSHPRILRWLATKSNTRIKEVMHPWIVPTEQELGMTSFITLGLVDTIADPMVELIKKELAGATSIRRAARQDMGASFGGVSGRFVDVGGRHVDVDATSSRDEIFCLMRGRQLAYPESYEATDRKMDLNFYKNFKPLLDLFPNLLRQSKLMDDLPVEVLMKKTWDFEGGNKDMDLPRNKTVAVRKLYALAYIECLLTGTEMNEPTTFLYDNALKNMQEVWAYGVLTGRLEPVYK